MYITIFGAGPGISDAVARLFGKKGFDVALVARNEEKLQQQVQALQHLGINAMYAVADVADEQAVDNALQTINTAWGIADMTLYNASVYESKDILEQDWPNLIRMFNISAGGAFHVGKRVLSQYLKTGKGKLFFTGGGSALQGDPNIAGLGLGKAGMRYLVQAFAKRAAGTNVHVAQITVRGSVNPEAEKHTPDNIAAEYWRLYQQAPGWYEEELMF